MGSRKLIRHGRSYARRQREDLFAHLRLEQYLTIPNQTIGLEGKNLWMKKNVGQEVASIGFASLQLSGSEQAVSSTQDSELICSYNWSDSRQPTILVPGTFSSSYSRAPVE